MLAENIVLRTPNNINEYWVVIENDLHSAGLVRRSLTHRVVAPWTSVASLRLFDTPQTTHDDSEYNEAQLIKGCGLSTSLFRGSQGLVIGPYWLNLMPP